MRPCSSWLTLMLQPTIRCSPNASSVGELNLSRTSENGNVLREVTSPLIGTWVSLTTIDGL